MQSIYVEWILALGSAWNCWRAEKFKRGQRHPGKQNCFRKFPKLWLTVSVTQHRWSWLWTAFASTRTGLGKQKDWDWSVIREKGSNRGLTGPFLLYYYWPGSIFEFNESSSSKWFFSAFLLFWLVKKEHTQTTAELHAYGFSSWLWEFLFLFISLSRVLIY